MRTPAHTWFFYAVYASPAVIVPFFALSSPAPGDNLLEGFGLSALYLLLLTLYISPLRLFFPKNPLLVALSKKKRGLGLSIFYYACAHLVIYVLQQGSEEELISNFSKPFAWFGSAALLILVVMALTSNRFAFRSLGGKRWKRVHRSVYLLLPLLFIHLTQSDKGDYGRALYLLAPITAFELYRFGKFYLKRTSQKPRNPRNPQNSRKPQNPQKPRKLMKKPG